MKSLFTLLLLLTTLPLSAQIQEPVKFTVSQKEISNTEFEIIFSATIDNGWHIYAPNIANGGPTPTTIIFDEIIGAEPVGNLTATSNVETTYDNLFAMQVSYMEHNAILIQKIRITAATYSLKGRLNYGACNKQSCLPPTNVEFAFKGNGPKPTSNTIATKSTDEMGKKQTPDTIMSTLLSSNQAENDAASIQSIDLWAPVTDEMAVFGEQSTQAATLPAWRIFLLGLLGGFIALLTPCVWPIIPMTVSFFLKRASNRRKAVRDAVTYGMSIVIIYVLLGLIITTLFGASALNALSTNALFNIFCFLMLTAFAASLFGAFEITLPTSWTNAVNNKAETTTGLISIFLMAFTLTLVSFSCTGPIIGFLLVEVSATGSIPAPTIGMLGFAVALALPFALFALFPAYLKALPHSGSWMNCVKVTLAFVELAFALKFLSVADLAYGWHILDRETFLALWIVIFAMLGAYLIGWLRFPHDARLAHTSVPRFLLALISFAFALYMLPGLWGAPLKAVSAFAPPLNTQDFNLYNNEVKPQFLDYDTGMQYARAQNKPVMLDFTGYGCVNCRKMELAVWSNPNVSQILNNDYVLISLYVDDKTKLPHPVKVTENGQTRTLRTVGDRWSHLQRSKFGTNAQPFYILLDNNGLPLNKSYAFDEDVHKFTDFLQTGLKNYNKK